MEGVTYEQFIDVLEGKTGNETGPKIKEVWVPLPVLIVHVEEQSNYLIFVLHIFPSPLLLLLLPQHLVYLSCTTAHG